jgi:hypothetical protein
MSLIEFNWNPSTRQLRQFAVICLVALPFLGWMWGGAWQVVSILAGVGAVICLVGWVLPKALKPLFIALSLATTPIGIVIGELALLLVYFGVFLPIGLLFRLARRDALERTIDRSAKSYFQPKRQPADPARYYRQS